CRRIATFITWRATSSAARSPWDAAPATPTGSGPCAPREIARARARRRPRRGWRWSASSIRAKIVGEQLKITVCGYVRGDDTLNLYAGSAVLPNAEAVGPRG